MIKKEVFALPPEGMKINVKEKISKENLQSLGCETGQIDVD